MSCQLLLDKSIHLALLPRFSQPLLECSLGAVTAHMYFLVLITNHTLFPYVGFCLKGTTENFAPTPQKRAI